jgi:triphosphoribosyl-dephospho-CoA synthase
MDPTSLYVQTACLWEATARKVGNVHPQRDFHDTSFMDFAISAAVIGPVLARPEPLGRNILDAVKATRDAVGKNTNLGLILAIAPLARCPRDQPLRASVPQILAGLTIDDARLTYEAIRLANPGGLGSAPDQDVKSPPVVTLREVMAMAADRDQIARQYASDFDDVLRFGTSTLVWAWSRYRRVEAAIIETQLAWLATFPDSLIARKNGDAAAIASWRKAQAAYVPGGIGEVAGRRAAQGLDDHYRSDGNRLNPGTTADLLGAVLFAALHDRIVSPSSPFRWEQAEWLSGIPSG